MNGKAEKKTINNFVLTLYALFVGIGCFLYINAYQDFKGCTMQDLKGKRHIKKIKTNQDFKGYTVQDLKGERKIYNYGI